MNPKFSTYINRTTKMHWEDTRYSPVQGVFRKAVLAIGRWFVGLAGSVPQFGYEHTSARCVEIDLNHPLEAILAMQKNIWCNYEDVDCFYVGHDVWPQLAREIPPPMMFDAQLHRDHVNEASGLRSVKALGFNIVFVPWMEGILAVPKAPRHVLTPAGRMI